MTSGRSQKRAELAAETHPGRQRRRNEDAVVAEHQPNGYMLLAVADGMGGARGGDVASSAAVRGLVENLRADSVGAPHTAMRTAYRRINGHIRDLSVNTPDLEGMGTTLVAALVRRNQAWLANVGDSRAYVVRGASIQQITNDHSLVADQVRAGYMTAEEAAESSQRNIITRSLGAQDDVEVDTFGPLRLSGTTQLVLCSDGLHGVVTDEEISDIVRAGPPKESARRLIALANKRGGPDNISVIVYQAAPSSEDTVLIHARRKLITTRNVSVGAGMAALITVTVLGALLAGGVGGFGDDGKDEVRATPTMQTLTGPAVLGPTLTPTDVACQSTHTVKQEDTFTNLMEEHCFPSPQELAFLNPWLAEDCLELLGSHDQWEDALLRNPSLNQCLKEGAVLELEVVGGTPTADPAAPGPRIPPPPTAAPVATATPDGTPTDLTEPTPSPTPRTLADAAGQRPQARAVHCSGQGPDLGYNQRMVARTGHSMELCNEGGD